MPIGSAERRAALFVLFRFFLLVHRMEERLMDHTNRVTGGYIEKYQYRGKRAENEIGQYKRLHTVQHIVPSAPQICLHIHFAKPKPDSTV